MKTEMIRVTSAYERVMHWGLAISFLLLCFTGLAMMFHTLNSFSVLTGGMYNLKQVHNYSGLVFAVFLLLVIVTWWREAGVFRAGDGAWLRVMGGYIGHPDKVPEAGRYNAGQKIFFLVVAIFGLIMVGSGLIMWFSLNFSVHLVRLAFFLHALGFLFIFPFFFVHLYLSTIGVPGSAQAMLTGWVSRAWLMSSHPRWLREMERQGWLISGKKQA